MLATFSSNSIYFLESFAGIVRKYEEALSSSLENCKTFLFSQRTLHPLEWEIAWCHLPFVLPSTCWRVAQLSSPLHTFNFLKFQTKVSSTSIHHIAHIENLWVCIMTSLVVPFLEPQCQASHSLTTIPYFQITFYFTPISVILLCHRGFHLIDILTVAYESWCFCFLLPSSSIFTSYPSFLPWNINYPWYLHFFFLWVSFCYSG